MYNQYNARTVWKNSKGIKLDMNFVLQNKWKIRLQLTKPVTWPPLIWGIVCGAAASGTLLCLIFFPEI